VPCWPTRRAEGSLKEAGAGEVDVAAVVAVAPTPAGDGVAGGSDVAAKAALGWGAAGGAGVDVDVDAEGVEGVVVLGGAGAAFGWNGNELASVYRSVRGILLRPCTLRIPSPQCCTIPQYSHRPGFSLRSSNQPFVPNGCLVLLLEDEPE
jgi:hypothetical protein